MFKSLNDSPLQILHLVKPDVSKKFYTLSSDTETFATIDLIRGEGSLSRIETIQGSFTLKRRGFFMPYLSVRKEKSETDLFSFPLDLQGKSFFQLDGTLCRFVTLNLWKNQWAWVNDKNKVIIKYSPTVAGQVRGDVEISKDFTYLPQIELLSAVGAYFLLQLEDELGSITESK